MTNNVHFNTYVAFSLLKMNFWGYLLLPFIVLNNFSSSFRIIEMKESVSVFNATPTVATVKNFDLSSYSDVTMCIRVFFYNFPVETNYILKWFLIFSSEKNHILFNVAAHDTWFPKTRNRYIAIPQEIYQESLLNNASNIKQ